jgi:hypothetical protein
MRTRKADSTLRGYIGCPEEFEDFVANPWGPTKKTRMMNEWIFENLKEQSKPRDVIEWLKVKDMADNRTERAFFQNLKPGLIRKPRKQYYIQESGRLLEAGEAALTQIRQNSDCKLQNKLYQLKGTPDHIKAETERLKAEAERDLQTELRKIIDETNEKIRQVKHVVENDATNTDSFDRWIGAYEQVSDRIAALDREFEKLVDDFDRYRHGGLGKRLRKAANEIIEGEYEDEEEYEEELARPAGESADPTQTPLAPVASGDATRAEDTSTTGQFSPEGSQVETTPPSSGNNPD